jgi:7-carboxy-7-deazaguanine synthase
MLINEIFYSIQGEGPFLGMPAIFIRLAGCKEPYCTWCDTKYAWDKGSEIKNDGIIKKIKTFPCTHIVITGGEPFLQWKSGLKDLHEKLRAIGYDVHYETSGKIEIPKIKDAFIVCSPKYINGSWHLSSKNLKRASVFKFVATKKLFEPITKFIIENKIKKDHVYIMPMGAKRKEQLKNMGAIFDFCKTHGYRMTPRLQTLVFDGKQGV